ARRSGRGPADPHPDGRLQRRIGTPRRAVDQGLCRRQRDRARGRARRDRAFARQGQAGDRPAAAAVGWIRDMDDASDILLAAGLGQGEVAQWHAAAQATTTDYETDHNGYCAFWALSNDLLGRMPPKPRRNPAEAAAAQAVLAAARDHRERLLAAHVDTVYDRLTDNRMRFVRLENLVIEAGELVPGLTPTPAQVADETNLLQRDKEGIETDQGIFLSHVLASAAAGTHLCHAMLLPRLEAAGLLSKLATDGRLDLGATTIERQGK